MKPAQNTPSQARSPIRVLVVDDSALMRSVIAAGLSQDTGIEVVGAAADAIEARHLIKALDPDVLTLDVAMPGMNGLELLEKIMTLRPMPVVMVSSLTSVGAESTLKALELGAVDFVTKPAGDSDVDDGEFGGEIIKKVRLAAGSLVRRHVAATQAAPARRSATAHAHQLIAFGASTGGVEVLGRILTRYPKTGPAVVVVQHMPANFTRQFAQRLDAQADATILEASDGHVVSTGQVLIAPGGRHLTVVRKGLDLVCRISDMDPVSGHRPSVDVLFNSVATSVGDRSIGVILTGMGRDGADGLLAMRQAGALTIGQNEATSLVYGMPRVAQEIGAVCRQMPDAQILEAILNADRTTR